MNKKATPSPFPQVARPHKPRLDIDPELLVVEHNTPLPRYKSRETDKYGAIFGAMKPGSCVKCMPAETPRIGQALRKAIGSGRYPELKNCRVVSRERCQDGHGRVWAMPAEEAKATLKRAA